MLAHEHVFGSLGIVFKYELETVFQEVQIETEVPRFLGLPRNIRVGHAGGTVAAAKEIAAAVLFELTRCAPSECGDIVVADLSPTNSEATIVDNVPEVVEECFVGEFPRSGEGVEVAPAVFRTKVGRTVATVCVGDVVPALESVECASEERNPRTRTKSVVDSGVACAKCGVLDVVGRKTGILDAHVFPFVFGCLLTNHGGQTMVAECLGVGEEVLYLPKAVVVLAVLTCALIVEVGGREVVGGQEVVRVGVGVAQRILSVECEFGEEIDVGVERYVEVATCQLVVDDFGFCNWVLETATFSREACVFAVKTINRNVGGHVRSHRDDTVLAVVHYEVVVRCGEGEVGTHFHKLGYLCINVASKIEPIETCTDDSTFLIVITARKVVPYGICAA